MPRPPPILEVPIFGRDSLLPAIRAGARRIELNAEGSYSVGGTTPSVFLLGNVIRDLNRADPSVGLSVMIRPRGGNFFYSPEEKLRILEDILALKIELESTRRDLDGFVFGALLPSSMGGCQIDVRFCNIVLELCRPFGVVFHRAFDEVLASRWGEHNELAILRDTGFKGVLTSGGLGNAPENLKALKRVVEESDGQLEIIVGGGVRRGNILPIYEELRKIRNAECVVYHSSCLVNPSEVSEEVDEEEVRQIVRVLSPGPSRPNPAKEEEDN
jgi:copper homeostasis protein